MLTVEVGVTVCAGAAGATGSLFTSFAAEADDVCTGAATSVTWDTAAAAAPCTGCVCVGTSTTVYLVVAGAGSSFRASFAVSCAGATMVTTGATAGLLTGCTASCGEV